MLKYLNAKRSGVGVKFLFSKVRDISFFKKRLKRKRKLNVLEDNWTTPYIPYMNENVQDCPLWRHDSFSSALIGEVVDGFGLNGGTW